MTREPGIRRSINFRLNALFVLLTTAVLALTGTYTYLQTLHQLQEAEQIAKAALKARLSINLQVPVWNLDDSGLRQILNAELKGPVQRIGVVDSAGKTIIAAGTTAAPAGAAHFEFPLDYQQNGGNSRIGRVEVAWFD